MSLLLLIKHVPVSKHISKTQGKNHVLHPAVRRKGMLMLMIINIYIYSAFGPPMQKQLGIAACIDLGCLLHEGSGHCSYLGKIEGAGMSG